MNHKQTLHDADAILLYKVGPVHCCSPALPVESVMLPPHLTRTPGTSSDSPGVFKSAHGIVKVADLRVRFGVEEQARGKPGRIVVAEVTEGHAGLWVDEIVDVIQRPQTGWQRVPPHIPARVFSRTLLYEDEIWLYSEFEQLYHYQQTGYLRQHIEMLESRTHDKAASSQQAARGKTRELSWGGAGDISKTPASAGAVPSRPVQPPVAVTKKSPPVPPKSTSTLPPTAPAQRPVGSIPSPRTGPRAEYRAPARHDVPESKRSPGFTSTPSPGESKPLHAIPVDEETGSSGLLSWGIVALLILSSVLVYVYFDDIMFGNKEARQPGRILVQQPRQQPAVLPMPNEAIETRISVPAQNIEQEMSNGQVEEPAVRQPIVSQAVIEEPVAKEPADKAPVTEGKRRPDAATIAKKPASEAGKQPQAIIQKDDEGVVIILNDIATPKPETTLTPVTEDKPSKEPVKEKQQAQKAVLPNKTSGTAAAPHVIVHVVVKGDTLWDIARHYVHDPFRYPELARLSKIRNPDLIYPGDRVRIVINP